MLAVGPGPAARKLKPINAPLRRLPELEIHRDALSHPAKLKWQKADRQAFFDDQRRHAAISCAQGQNRAAPVRSEAQYRTAR